MLTSLANDRTFSPLDRQAVSTSFRDRLRALPPDRCLSLQVQPTAGRATAQTTPASRRTDDTHFHTSRVQITNRESSQCRVKCHSCALYKRSIHDCKSTAKYHGSAGLIQQIIDFSSLDEPRWPAFTKISRAHPDSSQFRQIDIFLPGLSSSPTRKDREPKELIASLAPD